MIQLYKDNTYFLEVAVIDVNGDFVTGLSISYEIRKSSDGSIVQAGAMTADGNAYKVSVNFSTVGTYRIFYVTPTGYANGHETIAVEQPFATAEELEFVKQAVSGRWLISGSEMIFYEDDNLTEIMRFQINLDPGGEPIERVRL